MADTILGALNELTQKLDDLDTQDELTTLGDKIDTLSSRMAPEGQSIQNTLHLATISGDGTPYLQNLSELEKMRRAISMCCSSGLTGLDYGDLGPVEISRKCKVANLIWDNTYEVFNGLNTDHADLYATGLTSGGVTLIVGTLAGVLIAPAVGVAAAFVALAVSFLVGAGTFNILGMLQSLTANKGEIICGLLNATDTAEARDVFQNEMTNVTKVELFFISLLMTNDLLNNLFNDNEVPNDYTPTDDCSGCGGGGGEAEDCPGKSAQWSIGTPSLLDGADPYNGSTTSELDGLTYDVLFNLGALYKVVVIAVSSSNVFGFSMDCDENVVCNYSEGEIVPGAVLSGELFSFGSNAESYTLTLDFTPIASAQLGCT